MTRTATLAMNCVRPVCSGSMRPQRCARGRRMAARIGRQSCRSSIDPMTTGFASRYSSRRIVSCVRRSCRPWRLASKTTRDRRWVRTLAESSARCNLRSRTACRRTTSPSTTSCVGMVPVRCAGSVAPAGRTRSSSASTRWIGSNSADRDPEGDLPAGARHSVRALEETLPVGERGAFRAHACQDAKTNP